MFRSVGFLAVLLLAQAVPQSCNFSIDGLAPDGVTVEVTTEPGAETPADGADTARVSPAEEAGAIPDPTGGGDPKDGGDPPVDPTGDPIPADPNGSGEPAPPDAGETDGLGGIHGRVFGRSNSGDPVPLEGALVELFREGTKLGEALTNAEGRYAFHDLPGGAYGLKASKEGYVSARARVRVVADEITEKNFHLRLEPPKGNLAGHVFGATPGEPQPVGGAQVALRREGRILRETQTNDQGGYGFADVPVGEYVVTVKAHGYVPDKKPAVVREGETTECNFLLQPAPPPGALHGHVGGRTPDGVIPLGGAKVRLIRGEHVVRDTVTNDAGGYRFPELAPGEYKIRVTKEGWEPGEGRVEIAPDEEEERNFILEHAPPPGAIHGHVAGHTPDGPIPLGDALIKLIRNGEVVREARTNDAGDYHMADVRPGEYGMKAFKEGWQPDESRVTVRPGETATQNFLLQPANPPQPGRIVGVVMGASNGGHIPLGNAKVKLTRDGQVVRTAHTNDQGHYEMDEVPPGPYMLVALAEGYQPGNAPAHVHPGEVVEVNFLLHPGDPPPPGAIVGVVRGQGPNGEIPIGGAVVKLIKNGQVLREVETGNTGHYEMADVPPGEYGMVAVAQGWQPADAVVQVPPGQTVEKNFLLQPAGPPDPGTIVGTVRGQTPDGQVPLGDAVVKLVKNGQVLREAQTNPDGHYEMADVPPGEYGMIAMAPGWQPADGVVQVPPGQTVEKNFLLEPAPSFGSVAGTVYGQHNNGLIPLPGAHVRLQKNGQVLRDVITNDLGQYEMAEVPPGEFVLRASKEGWQPAEVVIQVAPGQTTVQDFSLLPQ